MIMFMLMLIYNTHKHFFNLYVFIHFTLFHLKLAV
jgi:hypothetical protein